MNLRSTVCLSLIFSALFILGGIIGCGGSTTGTGGGVTVIGRVLNTGGTPLANVPVSILNTGDTAVSAQDGSFSIATERATEYDIEFDLGRKKVTSKIKNVPAKAKEVTARFEVNEDDDSDTTEPSEVEIKEEEKRSNGGSSSHGGGVSRTPTPSATVVPGATLAPTPTATPENHDDNDDGEHSSPTPTPTASGERSGTGSISAMTASTLTVNGYTYAVTGSTSIQIEGKHNPTISDLQVGDRVHIQGRYRSGVLTASEIEKTSASHRDD